MALFIIGAVLTLAGSAGWAYGSYLKEAEQNWLLWTILGIACVVIGLALTITGLILHRKKNENVRSGKEVNIKRLVLTAILLGLGSALSLV